MPVIPVIGEGADPTELEVNRLNTTAFIRANLSLVTLTPRTRARTGDGYAWTEGADRPTQMMRLIDQSSAGGPTLGSVRAPDGRQREIDFHLLGEWDAEVGIYDCWTDESGLRWEVIDLFPRNGYETRAMVARYGEAT